MDAVASRMVAMRAITHCAQVLGLTRYDLKNIVQYKLETFADADVREALSLVYERDELEHFLAWVYDGGKEGMRV